LLFLLLNLQFSWLKAYNDPISSIRKFHENLSPFGAAQSVHLLGCQGLLKQSGNPVTGVNERPDCMKFTG